VTARGAVAAVAALAAAAAGCGALPGRDRGGRREGGDQARCAQRIEEGEALLRQGRAAEAAEAFEDATYADAGSADAQLGLARALLALGRTYQAVDALAAADRLRPDSGPQRVLAGQLQMRLNDLDEADRILTAAVAAWPEDPQCHLALGALRMRQGRLGEAEVSLSQALRLDPELPGAFELLGRVLLRLGRTDQALSRFEQAIAQREGDDLAHGGLAAALVVSLQPGRAQAEFERAAALAAPADAGAWRLGLAMAYAAEGRFDDARAGLEGERSRLLRPPVAAALIARLRFARLGWEAAGCSAHVTICSQADQRLWSGALLLFVLGAADAAERELREALGLYDGDAATHWLLAEALAELGRAEDARLELDRAGAWTPSAEVQAAMAALRQQLDEGR
jgi:cellulose synthase operon protein C